MDAAEVPVWQIAEHSAKAKRGPVTLTVDLRQPAGGLNVGGTASVLDGAQLLGVVFDDVPAERDETLDCFVRQRDLVVTYPATDARQTRLQVYWRQLPVDSIGLTPPKVMVAAELQVSVQTDSLDILPRVSTRTRIATAASTQSAGRDESFTQVASGVGEKCVTLSRPDGGCLISCPVAAEDLNYVEIVHPADYHDTELKIDRDGSLRWSHRLLTGRLEKGVIVRARVRGLLLRGPIDPVQLEEAFTSFAAAAPPLTV